MLPDIITFRGGAYGSANAIIIDQSLNEHIYIEATNTTNAESDFNFSIVLYEI